MSPTDYLAHEALLASDVHRDALLRAAQAQSARSRCTVVALTAVGVDLGNRVPRTWGACLEELAKAVGATGFERLIPTPHDGRTPTGRRTTVTYARFVREHPTGVYLLYNTGHCTALVEGVFVDSEGHGPDTRRVQMAVRLLERPAPSPVGAGAVRVPLSSLGPPDHEEQLPDSATTSTPVPPPRPQQSRGRSRLLSDTCPLADAILSGEHDADLDYIHQAVQARRKSMFRYGARVRLTGTRSVDLDGREGTVLKVNARKVSVRLDDGREYNVPTGMLELV